ncbi:MAG: DNA methyltransferase, partial [Candidatus Hermodarchaeota archaeon]
LESYFKDQSLKLIFLDLSQFFPEIDIVLREEFSNYASQKTTYKKQFGKQTLKKSISESFWTRINIIFRSCESILGNGGFFGVMVNGAIKHLIKSQLDTIFGLRRFVNEILIDSPYNIIYSKNSNVFERTKCILLFSKTPNPRIKPVFNEKKSGGYWHSFISKGQGSPKKFIFSQGGIKKEVILEPPPGTHWKLKQESILRLCEEGKIRLNKKGNPEYWVQEKYGQIIDSNWLDISSFEWQHDQYVGNSFEIYKRLMRLCMNEGDRFLDLSTSLGNAVVVANKLKMKWIGIEENEIFLKLIAENLLKNNISFFPYKFNPPSNDKPPSDQSVNQTKMKIGSDYLKSSKKASLHLNERFYVTKTEPGNQRNKDWTNKLILGDCLDVLQLLESKMNKSIKLIYIDPPFFTGTNETIIIPVGLLEGQYLQTKKNLILPIEDLAYKNILDDHDAVETFKKWFEDRLRPMKPLLRDDGFIFVRFDYHFGTYAKLILDKIFGIENFVNEFLVRRMKKNLSLKQAYRQTHLIVHSDSLYVYRCSEKASLNISDIRKRRRKGQDPAEYQFSNDNLWIDIAGYQKTKKTLYPTENSEILLTRIIKMASEKGDIIADFFCGSGTTIAVAEKLQRRWVGVDIGHHSIHEIKKRILKISPRTPFDYFTTEVEDSYEKSRKINPNETESHSVSGVQITPIINGKIVKIQIENFKPKRLKEISQDHNFLDLIDYWLVVWDYQEDFLNVDWYSSRKMKGKTVLKSVEASIAHKYATTGDFTIAIKIVDVFGDAVQNYFEVSIN